MPAAGEVDVIVKDVPATMADGNTFKAAAAALVGVKLICELDCTAGCIIVVVVPADKVNVPKVTLPLIAATRLDNCCTMPCNCITTSCGPADGEELCHGWPLVEP